MTFNEDEEDDDNYSANMIQVVLEENLENTSAVSESFAMTSSSVSIETDGFPDEMNPVILDGACTHIMFNYPGHFVDLNSNINGYVQLGNNSKIPARKFGTVNIWNPEGSAHPNQLRNCLHVPELKYSLIGEDELYRNGFWRQSIHGVTQVPYIECMNNEIPPKAVTEKFKKLTALPSWVFYPYRRTPKNWRQMRDSTRGLNVKSSNKVSVRSGGATVNVTSASRLKHMASRNVRVISSPEPRHENVILSDLPYSDELEETQLKVKRLLQTMRLT